MRGEKYRTGSILVDGKRLLDIIHQLFISQIFLVAEGNLRCKTSSVFRRAEQPDGAEEGEALGYPGPDNSHLRPSHNTGGEAAEVHRLDRLPFKGTLKRQQREN